MTQDELPPGWAWASLGEVVRPQRSKTPADPESALPFLGLEHINANGLRPSGFGRFSEMRSAGSPFGPGDVLYGRLRPYLNKVWRADREGVASAEFIVFPQNEDFNSDFLSLVLHHQAFVNFASGAVSGDRPRIDVAEMAPYRLAVPPLAEQERIVTAVNDLFADMEAGEAALARAREALTQFRASLLHAAVTGQLTEAWRAANPPTEDGSALLRRILSERRTAWERAERARLVARRNPPRGDAWKARYVEAVAPALEGMPQLPAGWAWASLDQLALDSSYGTSTKCDPDGDGVPVLRIPNVQGGRVDWRKLKYAKADLGLADREYLAPGDLLIVRTNGSENLIGRAAVVTEAPSRPSYFASYLIRFRLIDMQFVRRWVGAIFGAGIIRQQIARVAASSAGQYNVSQTNLSAFAIPLPPAAEMPAILEALESAVEPTLDEADAAPIGSLRQSILHAAFTGRLVPQDPNDEPAEALLARLREASTNTPRRTRRRVPEISPA